VATSGSAAHQLFDEMPARDKVSKFENFPLGFCSVVDKVPRHMLVWSRYDGLVEKNKSIFEWSLYQIQTLAAI
jgi:hypothetical protein